MYGQNGPKTTLRVSNIDPHAAEEPQQQYHGGTLAKHCRHVAQQVELGGAFGELWGPSWSVVVVFVVFVVVVVIAVVFVVVLVIMTVFVVVVAAS